MRTITQVIATNDVVRLPDGTSEVILGEALADAAEQLNASGGMPILVDHDWTRLSGWTTRMWIERDGKRVRLCAESQVPESPDERDALSAIFTKYCADQHAERTGPHRNALAPFPDGSVDLCHDFCCVYLTGTELVKRLLPELQQSAEDDGLVPIAASSEVVGGGWLRRGSYLLAPDTFLRPGWALPNPPNRHLIAALAEVKKRIPSLTIRLAIDSRLAGIPESLQDHQQRDYWWGPPFKGNPGNQAHGVTVHGPTKYDSMNGLKQTEFWWYGKDERTFQIEEVLEEPRWRTCGNERRTPARFVHSIFDPNTGRPCHLDGAVRLYTDHEWSDRLQQPIDKFGKRGVRHKLWAVDGDIQLNDWYTMIHMFFKRNFTIAEYFGLEEPTRGCLQTMGK